MGVVAQTNISEAVEITNSAISKYGSVIENNSEYSIQRFSGVPSVSEVQERIDSANSATDELSNNDYHRKANKLINELYRLKQEVQDA